MHFLVWLITFQDSDFNLVPPTLFVLQAMSQCVRVQLSALFGPYLKSGLCVTSSGSCCYPRSQSTDVPCHVGSVLFTVGVESLKICHGSTIKNTVKHVLLVCVQKCVSCHVKCVVRARSRVIYVAYHALYGPNVCHLYYTVKFRCTAWNKRWAT